MKALKEAWFEFKGVRSDAMGVMMIARPQREQPSANGENRQVAGRSGRIWLGDGSYDNGSAEVTCVVPDGDMDAVLAWLTGSGWLRFSDEPDRAYQARAIKGIARTQPMTRLAAQKFTVQFDCQPFRYAYPEPADVVLTAAGYVTNPGTAAAQPKIRIEGSGDISVSIGGYWMAFEGVTDGVVVDCALMDVLNLSETQLMNGCAEMDEFPTLQPGANYVSWTGDVTRIVISPRWRYV